jgi:hypothetical protein
LEFDVQQGNFMILQLLLQVLILFLVEKWIFPTRSEIAEIGPKNKGILGVNRPPALFITRDSLYSMFKRLYSYLFFYFFFSIM